MKNKILNIGSITKDTIITEDDKYNQIGGAVFYQLCTFNQLKVPYISIIMIGKDDEKILKNIPTSKIKTIKNQTTMQYTNIYKNNKRQQKAKFPKEKLDKNQLKKLKLNMEEFKLALISPLSPYEIDENLLKYLKENSLEILLTIQGFIRKTDPDENVIQQTWKDHQKYLKYADIISSDEEEFKTAFNLDKFTDKKAMKILNENNLNTIIITRAEKGSKIYTKDKIISIPAIKTKNPIDYTGLGDTYIAAFASKKDEYDIKTAGLYASLVAKEKLEHKGALKTSKKEIERKFDDILNQIN